MSKNKRNFSKDDNGELKETNEKLKAQIRKLQKEVNKLKSENKTLTDAWNKTSVYLKDVTQNKPLSHIIKNVDVGKALDMSTPSCPKCSNNIRETKMGKFIIRVCNGCDFREKLDEISETVE